MYSRLVVSHFWEKLKQNKLKQNQNSSKIVWKTQADFSKTQCFGKFLVLLCSNCDVTLINFTKTEGFYQKLKEISLKHEEFSQKLKDFPKKLKEFPRKLNFTEKIGAWVAGTSAKRQAWLSIC